MTDENKTERLHMLISPSELKAIDDWGFKNRIRTKAEAVRRLCQIGLAYERDGKVIAGRIARTMKALNLTLDKIEDSHGQLPRGLKAGLVAALEEQAAAFSAATAILVTAQLHSDGGDESDVDEIMKRAEGYVALLQKDEPK